MAYLATIGMPPQPDEAASQTPEASSLWRECLLFLAMLQGRGWGVGNSGKRAGDSGGTWIQWPLG